ncbi:MAG: hypothetical protein ACRDZ1_14235 [Acidimicrobiia bacterium]
MHGRRAAVGVVVGTLTIFGIAGCDGDDEVSIPGSEGEIEVDGDGGEVKIGDGKGSVSVGEDLPDDFPEGVPLPEGKIAGSLSSEQGGDQIWTVTFERIDGDISDYRNELEDEGYQIEGDFSGGSGDEEFASFTAVGDDYSVSAAGTAQGVVITVGPPDLADFGVEG